MTDKTEETSWSQTQLAVITASQEPPPKKVNKRNFLNTLQNVKSVTMKVAFSIDQTEVAEW